MNPTVTMPPSNEGKRKQAMLERTIKADVIARL